MIRVLLWDIDNTLLDFPAAERLALQAAFRDWLVSAPMTTAISSMPSRMADADRQYPAPEVKPVFSPVAPE